ncbi:ABC transporter permease [Mycolicibacterium mucogenicum]|uniref:ABC transporter permease n=1 Tax=Mycolicibacterium mucogenicum TaxID=56689 RepID=A0A1A3HAY1_MYCMU|nr:ABC transporter permease [Mycolicibacterium mucogenicum]OBJ45442.1 ABC transporter permease [Mycolicibacterium mucogenicum]
MTLELHGSIPSPRFPALQKLGRGIVGQWDEAGAQTRFYLKTLAAIPDAVIHYRPELIRLIAQMGLGSGALAAIGGTVVIVGFMTMTTGAIVAAQGYTQFQSVGVQAFTGFASAFFIPRLIIPGTAQVTLTATVGAGSTAQIGAMKINEEVDALEVIGIRSVTYLAATRVIAGTVVVIPLYAIALMAGFVAARLGTTAIYGQAIGVYDHYFETFLNTEDLIWSFVQTIAMIVVVMMVCTYYGYHAGGGPAGVGEAVGRAVRASMVVGAIMLMAVTLAVYGQSGNFHLAG